MFFGGDVAYWVGRGGRNRAGSGRARGSASRSSRPTAIPCRPIRSSWASCRCHPPQPARPDGGPSRNRTSDPSRAPRREPSTSATGPKARRSRSARPAVRRRRDLRRDRAGLRPPGIDPVARPRSSAGAPRSSRARGVQSGRRRDRRRGRDRQARGGPRRSVGPFGRVVAVDLSPAMVERGNAETRDLVQLEYIVGDALAAAVRRRPIRRRDDRLRPRRPAGSRGRPARAPTGGRGPAAGSSASSRRCPGRAGGAGSTTGPLAGWRRSRSPWPAAGRPIAASPRSSGTSPTPTRSPT